MEYIVKVCGEVVDNKNRAYTIKADSETEAKKIAKQRFNDEYLTNGNVAVVEQPIMRGKRSIIALILMAIPILLSFIDWKYGHNTFSISPNMISCVFGVIIYAAFVIRFKGVQRTVETKYDVLFTIFSVLLLSSFIRILLFEKQISIFGIFNFPIDTYYILIVAGILSWLGLKVISMSCMGLIVFLALGNIIGLNAAMGTLWGTFYIISSFIGVLMYISVEPTFLETKKAVFRATKKGINYLNNDLSIAKSHATEAKKAIEASKTMNR